MQIAPRVARGGLAPWQERRAKELMSANLDTKTSLTKIANDCSLSVSHFARAFRRSTGMSPYSWLVECRIEQAKDLLDLSPASLAQIATECGFADQSHMTRVFSQRVGATPGAWRRVRQSSLISESEVPYTAATPTRWQIHNTPAPRK
jgi:AraC family transcriptional regulator